MNLQRQTNKQFTMNTKWSLRVEELEEGEEEKEEEGEKV